MGNILIGIKRFLKNKNTVTIIAVLASIGILYWAYDYRIQKDIEPVSVPYATRKIGPRTQITSDMVSIKKVSKKIASKNVLVNSRNIIGRYTSNKVVVPEGSMFYNEMVVDLDQLPTSLFDEIPQENTVIYLPVGMDTTYGNSIFPGNAIDLYFRDGRYLGRLITSIKVLAVVDSQGNSVFETAESPKIPAALMFSVPDDIYLLLRKAMTKGYELFPVPRNKDFTENAGVTRTTSKELISYIEKNTVTQGTVDKKEGSTK